MKVLLLFSWLFLLPIIVFSQNKAILAEDDASNYSTETWTGGSNQGTGFGNWDLWVTGGTAGHFIASSTEHEHGDINSDNLSFGMFAFDNQWANAQRSIEEWGNGHTFSIEIAVQWRSGGRGISLFNTNGFANEDEIWNFNINDDGYSSTGFDYHSDMILKLEVTQNGENLDIIVTGSSESGTWTGTWNTTINSQTLGGFRLYTGGAHNNDPQRNTFFNNLKIMVKTPEKLVITNHSPSEPYANESFSIVVQAQDEDGNPANVTENTTISINKHSGPGNFAAGATTSASINEGSHSVTFDNIIIDTDGTYQLYATTTSGMDLSQSENYSITIILAGTPTINVNPNTLSGFTYVEGEGPSNTQSFTVSGENLTNPIIITPTASFEISLADGGSFSPQATITLSLAGNEVSNTNIFVRLKEGLDEGDYIDEVITITSTGATSKSVTCSGSVSPPSTPDPNYGMRDDGGTNLPALTYWHSGTTDDITELGVDFNTNNFGNISGLYIKGANIKTWKFGEGNVTGAFFKYKVWQESESEPAEYTVRSVGFTSEETDDGFTHQVWADFGEDISIINDLPYAQYNIKILFEIEGEGVPGRVSDGPFTAAFSISEEDDTPSIGWTNLHFPATGSVMPESEFVVYARVLIDGITGESATAQDLNDLSGWIGYSENNATTLADFEEDDWVWIDASLNDYEADFGNNSQYSADIGSGIKNEGTYYFVSRFQFEDGGFVYGGFDGGLWDGADNVSGVLTVSETLEDPEYGIRDDDGANLPLVIYWYSGLTGDVIETGGNFDNRDLEVIEDLYIKGANIKIWKYGEGNVTDANFHYKVWKKSEDEPAEYTVRPVGFTSEETSDGFTNQVWADFGDETNIAGALAKGTYYISIKFSIEGEGVPGKTEDGPFTAEFEIERLSSAAEVLTFNIDEQADNAVINNELATIDIQVVFGTNVTALTPSITISDGATIDPPGGTEQDFTDPFEYIVTAEDGTAKRWTVTVAEKPLAQVDWANIQFPPSGEIEIGDDFAVYTRVYVEEMTGENATEESLSSLKVWIGYNTSDANDTEDFEENWEWIEAALDDYETDFENNSQFSVNIGPEITNVGSYFYVSRFQLDDNDFVYGGYSEAGGGFWDGDDYISGSLIVNAPAPQYGIRDDDGVNLPTITYWHSEAHDDITERGLDFNENALGEIDQLYIKGASIKTWKIEDGDVAAAEFKYKVWEASEEEPDDYIVRDIGWSSGSAEDGWDDDIEGNQTWADFGDEINILQELDEGVYKIQILFSISGTGVPGRTVDGPYIASFEYAVFEDPEIPEITFANLQYPGSSIIDLGDALEVIAQVVVANADIDETDGLDGLEVWIGYNDNNTDPSTWTNWTAADYNGINTNTSRPEYIAEIGDDITQEGIYYYASRFRLNDESFIYGGYNATGGGFWDGNNNVSGVLTVELDEDDETFPVTFTITNENSKVTAVYIKGSFNEWTNILMVNTSNNIWESTFNIEPGTYEWGVSDQDETWLLPDSNLVFVLDDEGNITGDITFTIPEEGVGIIETTEIKPRIFPNPAHNSFKIEVDPEVVSTIRLMDISGRLLLEKQVNDSDDLIISVNEYQQGLYFVEIIVTGSRVVLPLIINY